MKKLFRMSLGTILLFPAVAFAAPPAPVQGPAQAPAKAVQAPAQAPVQAPAKTAQADTGYRTYSYQPAAGSMNYNYNYGYRRTTREPGFFSGLQRADYKVKGEFWAR